jgi:signal transduction histidine kinase/CheY-like chemotaxis protein
MSTPLSSDPIHTLDELRARNAELAAIFQALPDLMFELADDGRILSYRAGRTEDLYVAPSEFLGKTMCQVLPRGPAELLRRAHERVLAGERLASTEYALELPSQTKHFEARFVAGVAGRTIVLVRDVTELRREQEERRHLDLKVQEAQRLESLGVLAGGIAHDFNNLLAAIIGAAEVISRVTPAGSPLAEATQIIEDASWRASELSRQLLAYAGKGRFEMRHLSLGSMVLDTAQLLDTAISKDVHLDLDLPEDVPAVHADVAQVRQLVVNLVTNASESIEGVGRVTVRTRRAGDMVELEVSDEGRGMDAATRQRMFDPFYSTKGPGRGLGLASVLGIVRAHGGEIEVESERGRGTRVTVRLPASTQPAEPLARVHVPPRQKIEGGLALVVDDEPGVRTVTARLLEAAGLDVLTAADGPAAVAIVTERGDLDLVVLDKTMPGMGGDQTLEELRRIDPSLPVILTSGYDPAEPRASSLPRGTVVLQKPYRASALLSAVRAAISARRHGSGVRTKTDKSA